MRMRPAALAALPVAAVLVLAACSVPEPAGGDPAATTTAPATATAEPTPSPTPEAPSAAPVADAAEWQRFATDDGSVAFRYPGDWELEAESVDVAPSEDRDDVEHPFERQMDSATLTAPNGQELLQMSDVIDVGGSCGGITWPVEVLATEEAPGASFDEPTSIVTMAIGTQDGRWTFGAGLMPDETIPESGNDGCLAYFIAGSSDGGVAMGTHHTLSSAVDPLWTIDGLDDARSYMESDEYATILEVLRSVELR